MTYPTKISKKNHGMTLVELMFTLALMAILMMLAVPSFNGAIASSRLTSSTNELYTAMAQAKSEAVKLGQRVTVCASNNGTECSRNGTAWSSGWITFVDATRTGTLSLDTGETILAVGQAMPESILISGGGGLAYLSFSADARSRDLGGGFLISTFRVCSTSPDLADTARHRQISTVASGRLTVKQPKELPTAGQAVAMACPPLP